MNLSLGMTSDDCESGRDPLGGSGVRDDDLPASHGGVAGAAGKVDQVGADGGLCEQSANERAEPRMRLL